MAVLLHTGTQANGPSDTLNMAPKARWGHHHSRQSEEGTCAGEGFAGQPGERRPSRLFAFHWVSHMTYPNLSEAERSYPEGCSGRSEDGFWINLCNKFI